jgi:Lrp/AsnC family leucine-responsive transcriptional regulator
MKKIDKIDCQMLELLQQDCRMSLTAIAKHVHLSVDSVKKRMNKLQKMEIFFPKIQMRPRHFGFNNVVDIKIKLSNYDEKDIKEFVEYLKNNSLIVEIFSVSGQWDYSIVMIAKDAEDLGVNTELIRNKFKKIISGWSESLTTSAFKFEKYDMWKLINYQQQFKK